MSKSDDDDDDVNININEGGESDENINEYTKVIEKGLDYKKNVQGRF